MRIGIDLGGTKIQGIVMAVDGEVVHSRRIAAPQGSYQQTLGAIHTLVASLEIAAGAAPGAVPVGIGTPGVWQPARRAMKNCNSTWLNGMPLLEDLERQLGPRVRIANDADCFALSEAVSGAGEGCPSLFGAILGTGVGGGLVIDGTLLQGANGLAGEWGHTPLPYLGFNGLQHDAPQGLDAARERRQSLELESRLQLRQCYCGRRGCVETYLSGPGLRLSHRELWGEDRAPEAIAVATDRRARATLDLYVEQLARSLAQIINVFDPAVIVLGGGLSNMQKIYAPVNGRLASYVFSGECSTAVKPALWGSESGVRGAARLWPKP